MISDGKEYGSKAKFERCDEVSADEPDFSVGTLVGDSSVPGMGFVDRMHLPLMMRDNILPPYCEATGGQAKRRSGHAAIETSFAEDHRRSTDDVHGRLLLA